MYVRREELRSEYPDMHHLDVTKKIGEEWMAMSDEKKKPYLDAAIKDKIRYKMEMKEYKKKLVNSFMFHKINSEISCIILLQKNQKLDDDSPSKAKGKKKIKKVASTSDTSIEPSPKKTKKKNSVENKTAESPSKTKSTVQNGEKSKVPATTVIDSKNVSSSIISINNPATILPQPMYGNIPIFTEQFLEHNRQMETELKKLRKLNTDTQLQNSVLEKHVENVRNGITRVDTEIDELKNDNEKLTVYLDALRTRLATQLRNLSIPSEPNGANINNIDKYMNDLYEMVKNNSHGPASLNKARDLLRKVDLSIN